MPLQKVCSDHVLLVGQDRQGHWIVQEQRGREHRIASEGIFVSREAALGFARRERHAFPAARVEISAVPLASILAH